MIRCKATPEILALWRAVLRHLDNASSKTVRTLEAEHVHFVAVLVIDVHFWFEFPGFEEALIECLCAFRERSFSCALVILTLSLSTLRPGISTQQIEPSGGGVQVCSAILIAAKALAT